MCWVVKRGGNIAGGGAVHAPGQRCGDHVTEMSVWELSRGHIIRALLFRLFIFQPSQMFSS